MKKADPMRLANTFALATVILWVLCSAFVWVLPDFSLQASQWMMHGVSLSAFNINLNNILLGGVAWTVCAWITGWVLGWSWNFMGGKR